MNKLFLLSLFFLCAACHPCTFKERYQAQYCHLGDHKKTVKEELPIIESPYFLVVLVDAKHLDYSGGDELLSTVAKHPDASKERDVGHAWIILSGMKEGQKVHIEGGHSGELGVIQPRYLEGILLHQDEPNPVRYLFSALQDGYFEKGPGKHTPTYAIYIELNEDAFLKIYDFIQPERYSFSEYSLTQNQCTTFAAKAAAIAGIDLDHEVVIKIPKYVWIGGERIRLWTHPQYQFMTISTPDILEKSMIQAVQKGQARVALKWYK